MIVETLVGLSAIYVLAKAQKPQAKTMVKPKQQPAPLALPEEAKVSEVPIIRTTFSELTLDNIIAPEQKLQAPATAIRTNEGDLVIEKDVLDKKLAEKEAALADSLIPSPANPSGLDQVTQSGPPTIIASPVETPGLAESNAYFRTEKAKEFERQLKQTGFYDYQAGIGTPAHTSNFWFWLEGEKLPQYRSVKMTMGQGPYRNLLISKLDSELDLLNPTGVEQFRAHVQAKVDAKLAKALNANQPTQYPAVKDGLIHMGNGVYAPATSASQCPTGYVYLNNNPYIQGNWGCVSQARFDEIIRLKLPQINPMPDSVWQQVIQLNYAGRFYDPVVLTMPAQELIKTIRDRTVGCTNTWCKVVQDLFLTDTTTFANDRFTFKNVVWATMDNNYIAFYPIPVKVGGSTRTASPVYAMFPVTEAEYKAYKTFYEISIK